MSARDNETEFTSIIYKSNDRERVLSLCNYFDPIYHEPERIDRRIEQLIEKTPIKAAAYGK